MKTRKYRASGKTFSAKQPMVREARTHLYGLPPDPGGAIRRPSQPVLARLSKLERTRKGQIAAIEMGSQEIFVGKDVVEATLKGWKKYPGQSFYFVRIGYPAVHRHRGGLRKR